MKVTACMSKSVHSVRPECTLSEAARLLWEQDLGVLPVVDAEGMLRGMLTDRDICMAAFTSGRALHQLEVGNHMAKTVFALMPGDTLAAAEKRMAMHQLRRLPVVDDEGRLVGMLTLGDLSRSKLNGARVKALLSKICAPRAACETEPIREVVPAAAKKSRAATSGSNRKKPAKASARVSAKAR